MLNLSLLHHHVWIAAGAAAMVLLAGGVAGASLAIDDQPSLTDQSAGLQIAIVKSSPDRAH